VGKFPGSTCPDEGSDKGCAMDKFENCLMNTGVNQSSLVGFLDCFEGGNHASPSAAKGCAESFGIDYAASESCAQGTEGVELWKKLQSSASTAMSAAKCFPWVVLDGKLLSDPSSEDCVAATYDLLQVLCNAYTGQKPAGCP